MTKPLVVAAVFTVALSGGCNKADEDEAVAFVPKTVDFTGSVDSRYVGGWMTQDGNSTLILNKSGSLVVKQVQKSQAGESTSKTEGKWLADANTLRMQYSGTTIGYVADLNGNKLTLMQAGGRIKTIYLKKK